MNLVILILFILIIIYLYMIVIANTTYDKEDLLKNKITIKDELFYFKIIQDDSFMIYSNYTVFFKDTYESKNILFKTVYKPKILWVVDINITDLYSKEYLKQYLEEKYYIRYIRPKEISKGDLI